MPTFAEMLAAARTKSTAPTTAPLPEDPAPAPAAAPTRYGQCSRCGGPNDNPEAANGAAYCHGCTRDLASRPAANVAPVLRSVPDATGPSAIAARTAPAPSPAPAAPIMQRRSAVVPRPGYQPVRRTEAAPAAVPARPAGVTDLGTAAMLADVDVKMFTGTVTDKRVSREVHSRHGSDADMGRFSKRLVGSEHLSTIRRIAQEIGDEHRKRTLPWGEGRVRIIAAEKVLDYENALRNATERFDSAVSDLVAEWQNIVDESRRRLGGTRDEGGMFDPNEYPSAQMVRDRFKVKVRLSRLPSTDASDFRRTLGKAAADALEAQMRADLGADLKAAQQDMVDRIRETVGHMADRLKSDRTVNGMPAPAIFRDTLVSNVRDLANLVGSLNITNDPRLTDLAAEMLALASTDADTLRSALPSERQRIAAEAEDLVAKAEEMFG